MDAPDLVARLAQHRTLSGVPREELDWLAAHGRLRHMERGLIVTQLPELIDNLIVVLSGHMAIYIDRGFGPRKVMEWTGGDISGLLPYSRMNRTIGEPIVDEPGEIFLVPKEDFPEMIRECPVVTTTLVHLMIDRARRFTASDLQDEKMMSLGRLSAGLAHELNNPASAATRSARLLATGLDDLEEASRAIGGAQLNEQQLAELNTLQCTCIRTSLATFAPLERADREDAIAEWLQSHGAGPIDPAAFVDTALTIDDLDRLAAAIGRAALAPALRFLAADCTSRRLAAEVERAVTRVHDLVAAVKRWTYMDRTSAPEPLDLAMTVADSIAMLGHKARTKAVEIAVNLAPDLPRVRANGSDLNQVWTNLIDNAIDAVAQGGHISVKAEARPPYVIVRVIDDGPGIPPELRERIFDQFFTTKPVGQGTGLGLDIAMRLVRRNDGDIQVESTPGHTEFQVNLPIAAASPAAASAP
jgi:signal transduction histidine kinase